MSFESKSAGVLNLGKGVGSLVILGVMVYIGYKVYNGVKVAGKVITEDLNPVSDKNLVYKGTSSIVQAATGDMDATLGTKLYDIVDGFKGFLPFMESDKERDARLGAEAKTTLDAVRAAKSERAINYFDPVK